MRTLKKIVWEWVIIILLYFIAAFIISLFTGCRKMSFCIEGNGKYYGENRSVTGMDPLTKIEVYDTANLWINRNSINSIRVETEHNLHEFIDVTAEGHTLTFKQGNICPTLPIIYTVNSRNITEVELYDRTSFLAEGYYGKLKITSRSTGKIQLLNNLNNEITNLQIDNLYGEVFIWGRIKNAYFEVYDGEFMCEEAQVRNCYINSFGGADITVIATSLLDVNISGSGNVYYWGNPTIRKNITGSGELICLN